MTGLESRNRARTSGRSPSNWPTATAGYLPSPEQHELGGYETWPARSSFLEVQAEPKIREVVVGLLRDVNEQ